MMCHGDDPKSLAEAHGTIEKSWKKSHMVCIVHNLWFYIAENIQKLINFPQSCDHDGHKINQVISNTRVNPLNFP